MLPSSYLVKTAAGVIIFVSYEVMIHVCGVLLCLVQWCCVSTVACRVWLLPVQSACCILQAAGCMPSNAALSHTTLGLSDSFMQRLKITNCCQRNFLLVETQ